jgi:arylsulfatase A-like enzyme
MDAAVGEILAALPNGGHAETTVVIFTTDHGIAMPRAKGSLYDPGIAIALIVRGVAIGAVGGRRAGGLVSSVDILPTLAEVLELDVSPGIRARWQGTSFAGLVQGSAARRDVLFAEKNFHNTYDPKRCIRTGRHKLIVNFEMGATMVPGDVQTGAIYRAAVERYTPHQPAFELYDLHSDPWERENLADEPGMSGLRADLAARLRDWMRKTDDPLLEAPIRSRYYEEVIESLGRSEAEKAR